MLHEQPEEIREYVLTLLRKGPNDPVHPLPLVETNAKRADVAILQAMRTIPSSQQEKDEALAKVERDQRNNPNTRREHRVFPFLNATLAKEQGNALYLKAEYGRRVGRAPGVCVDLCVHLAYLRVVRVWRVDGVSA